MQTEASVSVATPVNKRPFIPCVGCGNAWKHHTFIEKRKRDALSDNPKVDLMFACDTCRTERVYGQEH